MWPVSTLMQLRDCQFQMRMVWSSEQLMIHGYSCATRDMACVHVKSGDLVEERRADVVQVPKQREQAPALLVVPHLREEG